MRRRPCWRGRRCSTPSSISSPSAAGFAFGKSRCLITLGSPACDRALASFQSCGRSAIWSGFGSGWRGTGGRRRWPHPFPKARKGLPQAIAQLGGGPPLQKLRRATSVERRIADLAGGPVDEIGRATVGCRSDELVDDGADAAGDPGPDVDRARGARAQGAQVGVGDVGDKYEVSSLVTVASNQRSPAGQETLAGDGDHARLPGSILEGPVDVRITKRQRTKPKRPAEHPEVPLGGKLSGPVGGKRPGRGSLRRRQARRPAVDRATGGREHEAAAAGVHARLEE